MQTIKVVIVEDLKEVMDGLVSFIRKNSQLELLATFRTAEAAAIELPVLLPDVVIMDINLPGVSGIECIRQVKAVTPAIQFMMFTVYENNDQVLEALKAGASGYLLKKTPPPKIIEAIIELYEGGSPMSSTIARKLVSVFQTAETKTNKEAFYNRCNLIFLRVCFITAPENFLTTTQPGFKTVLLSFILPLNNVMAAFV